MNVAAQIPADVLLPRLALAVLGISFAAFVLDRLALWMERRGWIYWRKTRRHVGGSAMGGMLTELQKLVEPQTEQRIQVIEERRTAAGERAVRGDGVDGGRHHASGDQD